MFKIENNKELVGAYLKKLIEEKYESNRKFCRAYLELADIETTDENLRKMGNRLSQILKGKKSIQTYDLPYVTELLMVSCEQILSCGKTILPLESHVTNYAIAATEDEEVWDKYMKREDALFAHYDEYGKSVIDYAIEFKNYKFMRYLLDNKFIWFVDNSDWSTWNHGIGFGAGTSIKAVQVGFGQRDNLPLKIQYEDVLRTDTISLAIENHDFEALDELKAREIPPFYFASIAGYPHVDYQQFYNERMIDTLVHSDEQILDYIAKPFSTTVNGHTNEFMYAYLDEVMDEMLRENNKSVELLIRRAIKHNKVAYEQLQKYMQENYEWICRGKAESEIEIMRGMYADWVNSNFYLNESKRMFAFSYATAKGNDNYHGLTTNIFKIAKTSSMPLIQELIEELNLWYEKIINMKFEV